ncbi:hypothetical protein AAF712_000533 [Marasmius tenuissimus]|uniref:BTB domain-containing protein n=1 Tax=Marasmius tenuissimus TaxID=585030 RepID=A0ABR3AGT1_9AGAR
MAQDLTHPTSSSPRSPSSLRKRARLEEDETQQSLKNARSKRPRSSTSTRLNRDESAHAFDKHYSNNGGDIFLKLPDGTLFMCHLEKLKTAGGLFGDVFALPQPVESAEKIEGLPFCDIYQTISPGEFRYVLDFIYGKLKLLRKLRGGRISLHFNAAIALLKGAHLLNLPEMRQAALKALHLMFPCDSRDDRWPPAVHGIDISAELFRRLFPIQAVNVLTQCEVPLFAPMAYYYASQLDIDDILFGVQRPDGSTERLNDHDKSLVLKGREKLRVITKKFTHEWLTEHGNERGETEHAYHGCWMKTSPYTGQTCFDFIQSIKRDWETSGFFNRTDCLNGLPKHALDILKKDVCSSCYDTYEPKIEQGVWDAWWELPGVYGLESWETLSQRQKMLSEGWQE